MDADSEIPRRMRELRKQAELTQPEAAEGLGVDTQTISRWERGESRIKAESFQRAQSWYLSVIAANDRARMEIGGGATQQMIRERFGSYLMPEAILNAMREFEFEAVRSGATNEEVDLVHAVFGLSETLRIVDTGGGASRLPLADQITEFRSLARALEAWLSDRIERRAAGVTAESLIDPARDRKLTDVEEQRALRGSDERKQSAKTPTEKAKRRGAGGR